MSTLWKRREKSSVRGRRADGQPLMFGLGDLRAPVEARLRSFEEAGYVRRLRAKDPTLWASGSAPEIIDRLGWLDLPETMKRRADGLAAFAAELRAEGYSHAVVLGMGGSSLAPDVFQRTFGAAHGFPDLVVLDSTHPSAVAAVEQKLDLRRTLFIVSSKSGTTIEPLSFFRYFWSRVVRVTDSPGRHFIAVTDPGTPLLALARERAFRRSFEAPSDVGGRFSALTDFGLVPAAVIGLDIRRLLESARSESRCNGSEVPDAKAPGLLIGAALGEASTSRDKVTFLVSPSLRSFPDWLEQLLAESTGKDGKGLVPVVGEPSAPGDAYGGDRIFVSLVLRDERDGGTGERLRSLERAGHPVIRIVLGDLFDLGREIFRWEVAVAAAGSVIGIDPFNQPDVELAKELARKAMAGGPAAGAGVPDETAFADDAAGLGEALDGWLRQARPKDYISIQAYLAPADETTRALQALRLALLKRTGLATTLGYGPRFLHSTGQLHKGGPNEPLVLQLFDEPAEDLAVPETDFTFGTLIRAQALGDYRALLQRGRRVLRVGLKSEAASGLERLVKRSGG
jgi:transaldolase/glucose-6-phosphate isomerase